LRDAIQEEPIAFFGEVLKNNGSVMDFIHSDYAMVNERLAAHYGIAGVRGPHFRRVPISSQAHRGGLLTGAAFLAMNSDGKDSNPLKRGVWMLKRILHDRSITRLWRGSMESSDICCWSDKINSPGRWFTS
ncbi:DUF1592 domain-containing protein, partial [bacterium]|nr:DUF1592 domain-containing protein [bacterium]